MPILGNTPPRLDPASRRAILGFSIHLGLLSALALWPTLAGLAALPSALGSASLLFALGGMVSAGGALRRGDRVGRGSLNGWDETLALVALSRLVHAAMIQQAS